MKQLALAFSLVCLLPGASHFINRQPEGNKFLREKRSSEIILTETHSLHEKTEDPYLGFPGLRLKATGYFRIEEKKGRYFFVTPTGNPYLALSVSHPTVENKNSIPAEVIIKNMKEWNYNAAGYNVNNEVEKLIPYFGEIYLIGPCVPLVYNRLPTPGPRNIFYDIFDQEVIAKNESVIRETCTKYMNDPLLIGYYLINVPSWYIIHSRSQNEVDYPSFIKRLPEDAPGKIAYVNFLKKKYSNSIKSLNNAYATSFGSFEDVLGFTFPEYSSEGSREFADDLEFHGVIAEQYYSTACAFIRKYDPNHLILGDRYQIKPGKPYIPDISVLMAAAKYVDVISVEAVYNGDFDGATGANYMEIHRVTNKPIMIADHDIMNIGPNADEATYRSERAKLIGDYVLKAFNTGFIIGHTKCLYFDRPNEKQQRGIVNNDNSPRQEYVNLIRVKNKENLQMAYESILKEYKKR